MKTDGSSQGFAKHTTGGVLYVPYTFEACLQINSRPASIAKLLCWLKVLVVSSSWSLFLLGKMAFHLLMTARYRSEMRMCGSSGNMVHSLMLAAYMFLPMYEWCPRYIFGGCWWSGCVVTVMLLQWAEGRREFRLCKLFTFITYFGQGPRAAVNMFGRTTWDASPSQFSHIAAGVPLPKPRETINHGTQGWCHGHGVFRGNRTRKQVLHSSEIRCTHKMGALAIRKDKDTKVTKRAFSTP